MTDLVIHYDREQGRWLVQRHGDHPRHVATFDTRDQAQAYVDERERS